MKRLHPLAPLAAALLGGCAPGLHDDAESSLCDRAEDALRQCGELDAADAFARDCDEETAEELAELDCSDPGKADVFGCGLGGCPEVFDDPVEAFAYGSIDNDTTTSGVPYWIFMTAADVCPDLLPEGGLASVGVMFQEGRDRPLGWSKRELAVSSRVGMNCAFCHTSTVRAAPDAPREFYYGGSAQALEAEKVMRLLIDCMASDSYTVDTVLAAIDHRAAEHGVRIGFLERSTYKAFVVAGHQLAKSEQVKTNGLFRQPQWGPGRADPLNIIKTYIRELDMTQEQGIGAEKIPVIWNGKIRRERGLPGHWDGTIQSWDERNLAASLALRSPNASEELADRITAWTDALLPPPFPFAIDSDLAALGESVYQEECAACHDLDPALGTQLGTIIPLDDIGTDPERSALFNPEFEEAMNRELGGYEFVTWLDTNGYVAAPIDGAWLRAPYLHNGSVPTMKDLLNPASERPTEFFTGYDVYDPESLGFVTDVAREGLRSFHLFETSRKGNRNTGHEYGVDRSEDEKRALLEYLKTL